MTSPELRLSFGHYDVIRELGRGSMGTVYLGRDRRIGREVAIKTIDLGVARFEDEDARGEYYQRLQREAEVSGSINHPNVVTLFEAGYENDRISYLAMEYVDGESLLDLVRSHRPGPIPLERATAVARDVLSGLACAHARGIVHRDIKPANVLLTADGRAKIADFGIARPRGSSITMEGTLIGTPDYMSPEQVRGQTATPASDLFSFGSLLFELLTGRKPFLGSDVTATLYSIVHGPTPIADEITSAPLREFVETLLSKKPEYRFPSAVEALVAFDLALSGKEATVLESRSNAITERINDVLPRDGDESRAKRTMSGTHVSRTVAAGVIGTAIAPIAIVLAITLPSIRDEPEVLITPEKLAEFQEKAEMMVRAESLCEQGRYQQCVAAYDEYLSRYPDAPAAVEGRQFALAALENRSEENPRPSRWTSFKNRVKGLFGK